VMQGAPQCHQQNQTRRPRDQGRRTGALKQAPSVNFAGFMTRAASGHRGRLYGGVREKGLVGLEVSTALITY
jgi:hypothetical protein